MMSPLFGFAGMIAVGALLIFIASNKKARSLMAKMHLSWHISDAQGRETNEALVMGGALVMGIFLIVVAFVLLILYL